MWSRISLPKIARNLELWTALKLTTITLFNILPHSQYITILTHTLCNLCIWYNTVKYSMNQSILQGKDEEDVLLQERQTKLEGPACYQLHNSQILFLYRKQMKNIL